MAPTHPLTPRDDKPTAIITVSELNHLHNLQSHYNHIGLLILSISVTISLLILLFFFVQNAYFSYYPERSLKRKLGFLESDLRDIIRLGNQGSVGQRYRAHNDRVEEHVERLVRAVGRGARVERVRERGRLARRMRERERRGSWIRRWTGRWEEWRFWEAGRRMALRRGRGQGLWRRDGI
ncbi:hypothetical protein BKA65DRAFT_476573 [Rhexocercosporidium sp. MPI-PUGE-AT-0058]|nr:hypothetical protein BKA65DRAFT_476573 [Rhexocercosporidium sp. MPI-PUGE-AT-0058]